jgi:uncharacterized protein with GYD domain
MVCRRTRLDALHDKGRTHVPHFMLKGKFSQESVKALTANPQDRRKAATAALESVGAKLKDYYFAFGDADVLVTYEAPDAATAASVAMTVGAAGAMTSVETIALLTMEEAMDAMKKSGKALKAYKPPSARPASK